MSNNPGTDGFGLGILLENRQVSNVIASYVGENAQFARQYMDGEIEVENGVGGLEHRQVGDHAVNHSSPGQREDR